MLKEFAFPLYAQLDDEISLEYNLHGNSNSEEKVVLIMGLYCIRQMWELLLDELLDQAGDQYHILTFDNRGIGGSSSPKGRYSTSTMANDTLRLMKYLGWEKAHIVGISMGGMISLQLARLSPHSVRSLSLLVTTAGFPHHVTPRIFQLKGIQLMIRTLGEKSKDKITKSWLYILYSDTFLSMIVDKEKGTTNREIYHNIHKQRLKISRPPSPTGIFGQMYAVLTHHISGSSLDKIKSTGYPILIFGATHDRLLHPINSHVLYKSLKSDHTTFVEASAGHGILNESCRSVVFYLLRTFDTSHNPAYRNSTIPSRL